MQRMPSERRKGTTRVKASSWVLPSVSGASAAAHAIASNQIECGSDTTDRRSHGPATETIPLSIRCIRLRNRRQTPHESRWWRHPWPTTSTVGVSSVAPKHRRASTHVFAAGVQLWRLWFFLRFGSTKRRKRCRCAFTRSDQYAAYTDLKPIPS